MTRIIDLSEGSLLAPTLKIASCRFFCLSSAAIRLPRMGKFVAPVTACSPLAECSAEPASELN